MAIRKVREIKELNDIWFGQEGTKRALILKLCRKPQKMIDIQRKLGIKSRGGLRHHLKILEKYGLIKPMKRNEEEKGRPTYIQTNIKKLDELKKNEDKTIQKQDKDFMISYGDLITKILKLIKNHKRIEQKELIEEISKDKSLPTHASMLVSSLSWRNYIKEEMSLTEKGEKFLNKNG